MADAVADASLVEALDDPGPAEAYSAAGYRRLAALGAELAALRRRTAQPLPDLVADVERTLLLDVEVAAAPGREQAAGRAHLDRFAEVAADFSVDAEVPTLGAFLAYLAAAEDASGAWRPAGSRWTPRRCRCSPCTPPRAWSGTSSRCPG